MIGVLLTESAKIQPMGWVLIIGFIVILVCAIIYDKKKSAAFDENVDKMFAEKGVYGNEVIFITSDNELVNRYSWAGVSGYTIFKLDSVKYIMSCWDPAAKQWFIGLYNEKKKLVVGEDHSSGKRRVGKPKASFYQDSESVESLEMIMKCAPDAQLVGMGFKEYKGSFNK